MIPKTIHYCWFGHAPLPPSALKCINSWKKYFPEYNIVEWNEDNFDVNMIPYTREAYKDKKYAFVSDFARFWILYQYGGIYFDTDVEVIQSFESILSKGGFMGIEKNAFVEGKPAVAPGLGMGIEAENSFYKEMIDYYTKTPYCTKEGEKHPITIVVHTTKELYKSGMIPSHKLQMINDFWIYPEDVFCPLDSTTGVLTITDNTVSIHHYTCSWQNSKLAKIRHQIKLQLVRLCGPKIATAIVNSINKKR